MNSRLTIIVGVTGGIAAYKTVGLVRTLVLRGHDVHVIATDSALRFVGKPTFEAISRNPVETDLYEDVSQVRHVAIGQSADLVIIAPATANTIAKLAVGMADDLLTNTVLATKAPIVIAPAMHTEMWMNAATANNIATLRRHGMTIVGPASGQLTGDDSGPGRMEDPETIISASFDAFATASTPHVKDFSGMRVLVSAGGTREPLDPVRFLGNRSSGRQGVALATAAQKRGALVTLIAANIETEIPSGIEVRNVGSARELHDEMLNSATSADVIIMAAAVADYRPARIRDHKIKKNDSGAEFTLSLVQNPDVLVELSAHKLTSQTVVGFAAETEQGRASLVKLGLEKIRRKGCDILVVNRVGWTEGFASDRNEVIVLNASGDIVFEASGTKLSVADRILDAIKAA